MWPFRFLPGWATPAVLRTDFAALARAIGHRDSRQECLSRRQGRCPGLAHCADCNWTEGMSRG